MRGRRVKGAFGRWEREILALPYDVAGIWGLMVFSAGGGII